MLWFSSVQEYISAKPLEEAFHIVKDKYANSFDFKEDVDFKDKFQNKFNFNGKSFLNAMGLDKV